MLSVEEGGKKGRIGEGRRWFRGVAFFFINKFVLGTGRDERAKLY
jgi:hypothetical protein